MNILFLTTAHNSLSQRAFVELVDRGHRVSVVIASSEEVMLQAVERELPDLIVAPMLKAVIPASIWQHIYVSDHPSRHQRRPGAIFIGLGSAQRVRGMGRHCPASRRRHGCWRDLGLASLCHARREQESSLPA